MSEFKEALGKDKGALKGLTGALEELTQVGGVGRVATGRNDVTTADRNSVGINGVGSGSVDAGISVESKLALDVKEVAKRLSEHMDNQQANNRQSKIPFQQVRFIFIFIEVALNINRYMKYIVE